MAECQEFCTVMNAMGHDSETIHGGMNEEEKENLFDRFDRGEVKVLVNIILLTEGFDCPDLQTVFVRPTESKGLGIQMAGRVLRLHQGKIKNIVECSSVGKNNFVRTAKPVEQYVLDGNEWHCISSNDAIETVSREMISAIVNNTNTTGDSMAALLKKKMKGKKKRSF
jgi:superfamily II DNA or RNA helicase